MCSVCAACNHNGTKLCDLCQHECCTPVSMKLYTLFEISISPCKLGCELREFAGTFSSKEKLKAYVEEFYTKTAKGMMFRGSKWADSLEVVISTMDGTDEFWRGNWHTYNCLDFIRR